MNPIEILRARLKARARKAAPETSATPTPDDAPTVPGRTWPEFLEHAVDKTPIEKRG